MNGAVEEDLKSGCGCRPKELEIEMLTFHNTMLKDEMKTLINDNANIKGENQFLQNELALLRSKIRELIRERTKEKDVREIDTFFNNLLQDPDQFKFFTGISIESFEVIMDLLGESVYELNIWNGSQEAKPRSIRITPKCQFVLTLIRLRQGVSIRYLSYQFNIGYNLVRRLLITWIQLLYKKFDECLRPAMFAPRSRHRPLPQTFRNLVLNKTRIVLDCTEIRTETSRHYSQQGHLYSNYKSHSTAKVLIGCAPCGACMFVSPGYEGSISDKAIVEKSKVLDDIMEEDQVVVDRGFTIEEMVLRKGGTLVIPPFLGKKKQFSKEETVQTKLIARARIHIERFNERIKNFKIISGVVPMSVVPLLSQIIFILCCLVNFQEPLVN